MTSLITNGLLIAGLIVLLLGAAYGYFVYSPAPAEPVLRAPILSASVQVGGRTRTYLAYVPPNLPANPGLVLVLHGSNIDGATIRRWTGYAFDEEADRHGFIVLYPDGYKRNWNDCRSDAQFPAKRENIDDVGFLRTLVGQFRATHAVDPAQVYAFGYSNGGQMAFRLAIEEPSLVRAIAVAGANLPTPGTCSCAWEGPTARVMLVSGTADPVVPYEGGTVKLLGMSRGTVISARATADQFARRNGLTQPPADTRPEDGASEGALPVTRLTWSQAGQSVVELYTVQGGGHVVPQARFRFPQLNGATATNLDTPAQALSFFGLR